MSDGNKDKRRQEIFSSLCTYETAYDIQARRIAAALGYDMHDHAGVEISRKIVLDRLQQRKTP